jgi:hypothetical protein
MLMAKLFFGFIAIVLLAQSAITTSFMLGDLELPKARPLVEKSDPNSNPLEALNALDSKTRASLQDREVNAYKIEPLDRGALQNLVALESLSGSREKAENIALALSALSRRSPASQLVAIQIELFKKDFAKAFERLDGVIRARPEQGKQLFGLFVSQLGDKQARLELAKLLSKEPPWRATMIRQMISDETTSAFVYTVLSDIRKAGGPVSDLEKQMLVNQLVQSKKIDQAYFVWLDFLDKNNLIRVRDIFDGGFETLPKNMYFDWGISYRKNARIEVGQRSGKPGDSALIFNFFAEKDGGAYVYQTMRLAPQEYRLTFEFQVDQLKNETGLVVRLICLESGVVIGTSSPIINKGPWESQEVKFLVPQENCPNQKLTIENKSAAILDQEITGRLAFDNFKIASEERSKNK